RLRRPRLTRSHGSRAGRVNLVVAAGRVHRRLRPQHRAALRGADRHRDSLDDPRFATGSARRRNCTELIGLLDEIFATRTRDAWGEAFDREDMWWAPVHTVDEVLADEQMAAAGAFVEVPDA